MIIKEYSMENTGGNQNNNFGQALLGFGLVIGAGYVCASLLDAIFGNSNDTVNYKLKNKGRLVYHGICFEDILDARLNKHANSGKKFDECVYDQAKPRHVASSLEKKRIRRDRPKYNIHHKY